MRVLMIVLIASFFFGCASIDDNGKKYLTETIIVDPGITKNDLDKIHYISSGFDIKEKTLIFDDEQLADLSKSGIEIKVSDNKVPYLILESHNYMRRFNPHSIHGYVFYVKKSDKNNGYKMIVCVHQDKKIHEIIVKDNVYDKNNTPLISTAFTDQFIGRSSHHSFELSSQKTDKNMNSDDIMPIKNEEALSESIAQELKRIAKFARFI